MWHWGVRTFPDIFENGEFFFRFSLSSTRKTVFSDRNTVFQKRSPEWRFFENACLSFFFLRKVRDPIVLHSLYPFRVQGQKRGIRYMSTRIFSKTEKKNIRFFRLDTCGHEEGR